MTEDLKKKLQELADKYEVSSFCDEDPSQFLRWYQPEKGRGSLADVEAASFIAAMLAFGNRKQFIPKIREILQTSERSLGSISEWLKAGAYKKDFGHGAAKFYRFYSYDDMQIFFEELAEILKQAETNIFAGRLGALRGWEPPLERVAEDREAGWSEGKAFPSLLLKLFRNRRLFLRGSCRQISGYTCFCAGW